MPDIRNLRELEKHLKPYLIKAMSGTGNKIADKLKTQIDEDVYDYNPKQYERTYELRESVDAFTPEVIGGYITVEVGHDYDKINAYPPNQHMSVVNGEDVSNQLPQWINDGTIGGIFGQGEWTKSRPYMDNMKEKIKSENIFVNELKEQLKKQGIKVD